MKPAEAQEVINAKGLYGSANETNNLIEYYRGNPLALKIAATSIRDLFAGNIYQFIEQETTVFNGISNLLYQQVHRLLALEVQVMYWLAINREPVSASELQGDIIPTVSMQNLLEALKSLRQRSLIETSTAGFTQQPVVMEYMTEQFIEKICEEIITEELSFFIIYPLIQAQTKDYIRRTQIRIILEPILDRLTTKFIARACFAQKLRQIISKLRSELSTSRGYGGGNVINLLCQLKINRTYAERF